MHRSSLDYRHMTAVALLVVASMLGLTSCGGTAPSATQAPSSPTAGPSGTTAAVVPPAPAVGGKLVFAISSVDTLDPPMSSNGDAMGVAWYIGSTLVAKAPDGSYVPYLATSWKTSDDGLIWDFTLRKDVKFQDGTLMTAKDFVYTIQRILDPATKAPQSGRLAAIDTVTALDDYTLRIKLKSPYPILLEQLSNQATNQPLEKAAVDKAGDQFSRMPLGVGPYKIVEWKTGERVVLERNPDFNWGPAVGANRGPWRIQTLEFRIIPEPATILSGLDSGEIDVASITGKDVQHYKDSGKFQILESLSPGMPQAIHYNVSKAPFNDVRVRQALNLAVDRNAMIKVIELGNGVPLFGPLSPNIVGYWPGIEQVGYGFDLAKAKSLMAAAGYTPGSDGMLSKDGQPLKLTLRTRQADTKLAELAKEQYKALGVDMDIKVDDPTLLTTDLFAGNYDIAVSGYGASESDILYRWFHTSRPGAINPSRAKDPELDKLLDATRNIVDPVKRQDALNAAQKYIVEQALVVPLYAPKNFIVVSNRVKGVIPNPNALLWTIKGYLNDAYIETK